ncbi:MAG: RNA-binding protein [Proteobacteria bacterium]|nr:RNA-binding protein [Pseudomonadota bacterium]
MTKIYVGNLPFTATEPDVRELFAQHGTVESVALPTDRETGRPRGFGFVEMPQADAQRAMQALNGFNMGGRPLRVNEAQDRPRTGGGGGGGGRPGGGGGGRRWRWLRRRWRAAVAAATAVVAAAVSAAGNPVRARGLTPGPGRTSKPGEGRSLRVAAFSPWRSKHH